MGIVVFMAVIVGIIIFAKFVLLDQDEGKGFVKYGLISKMKEKERRAKKFEAETTAEERDLVTRLERIPSGSWHEKDQTNTVTAITSRGDSVSILWDQVCIGDCDGFRDYKGVLSVSINGKTVFSRDAQERGNVHPQSVQAFRTRMTEPQMKYEAESRHRQETKEREEKARKEAEKRERLDLINRI